MVAANSKPVSQNIAISDETGNYRAQVTSDQALVVTPLAGGTEQNVNITEVAGVPVNSSTLTTGQNALSVAAEVVIAANANRRFAEVKNADNAINVYLGDDNTVTTANGHLLRPGESFNYDTYTGDIWAIAASGTPNVTFIEW